MELTQLKLKEFINILASDKPAPGGGSASALAGAMGAGLASMVAGLTIGRERYNEHEQLAREVLERAAELSAALSAAVDKDADAYNAVSAVFAMPKATDEEKSARKQAMQKALKAATESPFEVMLLCLAALECVEKLSGRSNVNAASDLGVAALNLKSAMQGAWLNVLINLSGITDKELAAEYKRRGAETLELGLGIAERVYDRVLDEVGV